MKIEVWQGDITTLAVDAIVNAANETLLGGGGVDGAIHRAAGPALLAECEQLPELRPGVRCPTGEVRATGAHALPARHVLHTVGPVWHDGQRDEPALLANCYWNRCSWPSRWVCSRSRSRRSAVACTATLCTRPRRSL